MFRIVQGVSEVIDQYDVFLIDLWGVTHDGTTVFPGAREVLHALKSQGKTVIFFSNAPRRKHVAEERLLSLGIPRELYTEVRTSGEQAFQYLTDRVQTAGLKTVFHIGTPKDMSLFDELGIIPVKTIEGVDAIVCSDTEHWEQQVTDFDEVFSTLAARGIPMICANADRRVMYKGSLVLCAGALAERYQELGGQVTFFGKPYAHMYDALFADYPSIQKDKVLAIGDSLYTDIGGATKAGIDTVFICGGIHMLDLNVSWGELPERNSLENLFNKYHLFPTFVLENMRP